MAIPVATTDDGRIVAASGRSCGTFFTSTNHIVTEAELYNAGGHLHILCSGGPVVIWLPKASQAKGNKVTLLKPSDGTNAYSFNATNGAKIENGTADKKYENVTAEKAACTLWCDGTNWHVFSQKGTWVANNT